MTRMLKQIADVCPRLLAALILMGTLAGCSVNPKVEGEQPANTYFEADALLSDDGSHYRTRQVYDPWEGFNRTMYRFNYRLDRYVLLPVVSGYQYITPDIVETGIHNFFNNLGEINTFLNSLLQLEFTKTVQTGGRFLTNSTVGLLGFIDVATQLGIPRRKEDFGQTLGYWGVGSGPYLVLPVFGPSSLRDGVGLGVDSLARSAVLNELDMKSSEETALTVMDGIDTRANTPFRYYETGSPFEYELVRGLWMTKRKLDIEK
ncbi:MlaA family lipoprotein [Aestuariirhabdus litorea]|uniref:VacJ family lipoprotein n=1 Tax=Aestuariirhabdus litorea TaxID=2528527 RepID=A0A3P3VKQ1_9GAMM|nr:VacJ family lipoprotein [Aestuariirhabdus litorea]RRJ83312.1 VacJ family lipoprotein [Aestuariirhabdus litorea]RWW93472.1 VacJ family lipoprotein [Endozoicomonadaceae bacterium GTF-13]